MNKKLKILIIAFTTFAGVNSSFAGQFFIGASGNIQKNSSKVSINSTIKSDTAKFQQAILEASQKITTANANIATQNTNIIDANNKIVTNNSVIQTQETVITTKNQEINGNTITLDVYLSLELKKQIDNLKTNVLAKEASFNIYLGNYLKDLL